MRRGHDRMPRCGRAGRPRARAAGRAVPTRARHRRAQAHQERDLN